MKQFEVIAAELIYVNRSIVSMKRRHKNLTQIDMLSGVGSSLREKIHKSIGMRDALEWVVRDYTNEDLHYDME